MVGIGPSFGGNAFYSSTLGNAGSGSLVQAGQPGKEKKVSFGQVFMQAMPDYLSGRSVNQGDETTQRYYKQLKSLNGGGESQATFIDYEG